MEIQLKYDTKDDVMAYVILPAVEAGNAGTEAERRSITAKGETRTSRGAAKT